MRKRSLRVIVLGLIVENLLFARSERKSMQTWSLQG